MNKGLMYIIIGVTTTVGAYIPTLWGADAFGGQSLLGTFIGGVAGVWLIWQMKNAGY